MNKQEAIEEIKNLKGLTILDKTINFDSEMISKKEVLNIVKQLDELEKLYEVFLKRTGAQLCACLPHGEDKVRFTKAELQEYDFDDLDVYEIKEVEE